MHVDNDIHAYRINVYQARDAKMAAAGCLRKLSLAPARRGLLSIRCSSFTYERPVSSEEVSAEQTANGGWFNSAYLTAYLAVTGTEGIAGWLSYLALLPIGLLN